MTISMGSRGEISQPSQFRFQEQSGSLLLAVTRWWVFLVTGNIDRLQEKKEDGAKWEWKVQGADSAHRTSKNL